MCRRRVIVRLAGDQLCHWNTLSPDAVFQATRLIVFLPLCLGTFVLSNHSSHNLIRKQMRAPPPVSNKLPTSLCPRYYPTKTKPSTQPVSLRRKDTSLPLPFLYLLNLRHLSKQRDLIGCFAFLCHLRFSSTPSRRQLCSSSSWKSGIRGTQASVVEVCVPEFSFVDFLTEDPARIQECLRADDVDNGLRQCFKHFLFFIFLLHSRTSGEALSVIEV